MTINEKVTEQLITILNESMLLEMAYPLKDIYRKIDDKIDIVNKHLILCFVFSKSSKETLEHWKAEVFNNMHRTWKIKGTNKLPTFNQLKTNCIDTWLDTFENSLPNEIESLSQIENLPTPNYNTRKLYECVKIYYEWLFTELSKQESINFTQISNKIDELIKEYNK